MPQLKDRARDGERHGKRESSQDETKHCPKKKKPKHSVRDRTKYFIPLRKSRAPEMNGSRNLLTVSSISNSCVFPFVTPSLFFFSVLFSFPTSHTSSYLLSFCFPAPVFTCSSLNVFDLCLRHHFLPLVYMKPSVSPTFCSGSFMFFTTSDLAILLLCHY